MAEDDGLYLKSQVGIQMGTCSGEAVGMRVAPRSAEVKKPSVIPHKNPHPTLSTLLHGKSGFLCAIHVYVIVLVNGMCVDMI